MIVVSFGVFFHISTSVEETGKSHHTHLSERFTHSSERHHHIIRCTLSLTAGMNKTVQLIILIRMRTPSSQLRLVEFRQRRWVGGIRNTEDIIHSIILVPVLHHSLTIRCKVHHLQTFTLLVVGIGSLRAITEFRIDRITLLIVTYLINNKTFMPTYCSQIDKNL